MYGNTSRVYNVLICFNTTSISYYSYNESRKRGTSRVVTYCKILYYVLMEDLIQIRVCYLRGIPSLRYFTRRSLLYVHLRGKVVLLCTSDKRV